MYSVSNTWYASCLGGFIYNEVCLSSAFHISSEISAVVNSTQPSIRKEKGKGQTTEHCISGIADVSTSETTCRENNCCTQP